tara:strand:- start:2215 stop:6060 length:3846 start_codon:yes stop_codon:yes gene_type:complete
MKKKDLYSVVKDELKKILKEAEIGAGDLPNWIPKVPVGTPIDPGTGPGNPIGIDPVLEPMGPLSIPTYDGCSQQTTYNNGDGLDIYINDPQGELNDTGALSALCQTSNIPQDFICCSGTNNDPNTTPTFSVMGDYNVNGLVLTNIPISTYSAANGYSCYCPNPTTVLSGTDTLLVSCGLATSFDFNDFTSWMSQNNLSNVDINSTGNPNALSYYNECYGCTYSQADNHPGQGHPFTADNGSCEFTWCNIDGFNGDGYNDNTATFCDATALSDFGVPISSLCSGGSPNIIANPGPNQIGVASVDDPSIPSPPGSMCVYTGCVAFPTLLNGNATANYVCSLVNALCDMTAVPPAPNSAGTFTDDGTSCPPINGCDNEDFDVPGGNYDPLANTAVPCTFTGCLQEESNGQPTTDWVCNLNPDLCDNGNNPGSQPNSALGTFTAGSCNIIINEGCTDSGYAEYSQYHIWDQATSQYASEAAMNTALCLNPYISGCTNTVNIPSPGYVANNFYCIGNPTPACTPPTISSAMWNGNGTLPTATVTLPDPSDPSQSTQQTITLVQDDGSCDWDLDDDGVDDDAEVVGCADPLATNTLTGATDPGIFGAFTAADYLAQGCTYEIDGCTDPNATNYLNPQTLQAPYSPTTTTINEDGSCIFEGCTQPYASNQDQITSTLSQYNGKYLMSDSDWAAIPPYFGSVGTAPGTMLTGQTDDASCNFTAFCLDSTAPDYVCVNNPALCLNAAQTGQCTTNPTSCVPASNLGTWTPGTCSPVIKPGCMDTTAGDPNTVHCHQSIQGNNSCGTNNNECCLALNYDEAATVDDGTWCGYHFCSDGSAFNYSSTDPNPNTSGPWNQTSISDDNLCEYEGCAESSYIAEPSDTPMTEYPGWSMYSVLTNNPSLNALYYYSTYNNGCDQFPGTPVPSQLKNGMFPTGRLDSSLVTCCAEGVCLDNGSWNQTYWNTHNYDTTVGVPTYPNDMVGNPPLNTASYPQVGMIDPVQANNFIGTLQQNYVDDGSCTYNLGCTISTAPNFNPNATVDDGSCLEPCKRIKAIQCNPDPNRPDNNPHHIYENCAHHGMNHTPQIGDQFWSPRGQLFDDPTGPLVYPFTVNCNMQNNTNISHPDALATQNYMAQYGMAGMAQGFTCQTQQDIYGFDYMWSANAATWFWNGTCINSAPNAYPQVQCSNQLPVGVHDPTGGTGVLSPAEEPIQFINAVFEIVDMWDDYQKPVTTLPDWSCTQAPPAPMPNTGLDKYVNIGPGTDLEDKSIKEEIKVSKKLRKLLKQWRKRNL